jgi:Uncharacterized conserved protein, contains double-stranded beta-helix domain
MNPLIQFKKILILPHLIVLALVVGALTAVPAFATPPVGVTVELLATGPFDELDVSATTGRWKARIDTKGESVLNVNRVTFQPGGYTGWHSHPGPVLVMVMSGTVTEYDGDDPSCTPHVYPAGTTFVEPGNNVHLVKNESTTNQAVMVGVALIPAGAVGRIDAPNPGHCPF